MSKKLPLLVLFILMTASVPLAMTAQAGGPETATGPDEAWDSYSMPTVLVIVEVEDNILDIGETTCVHVTISPNVDVGPLHLEFGLPQGLERIGGPSSRSVTIDEDEAMTFTARVLATRSGPMPLTVTITSDKGFHRDITTSIQVGPIMRARAPVWHPAKPFPENGARGILTVEGNWSFKDLLNNDVPMRSMLVELWDNDTSGTDDLIASTYMNRTGYFRFDVNNADADDSGTLDVYLVLRTDSEVCVVRKDYPANNTYSNRTTVTNDVADGTLDMGSLSIPNIWAGPYHILETINKGHDFLNETGGWSRPKIPVYFPYDAWPNSHGDVVHLPQNGYLWEWRDEVILHEYGHTIMYAVRGNAFLPGSGGSHQIYSEENVGKALSEGWANFYMCAVDNSTDVCWQDWDFQVGDIENTTAPDYLDFGDWDGNVIEGSISAIMWDIFDGVWDGDRPAWSTPYGDRIDGEFPKLWGVIEDTRPNSIDDIWTNWTEAHGISTDIWAVFYHYRVNKDMEPPSDPTAYITENPIGVWSNDNSITVNLSAASDDVSGIWGFNVTWSNSPVDPSDGYWVAGTILPPQIVEDGDWYLCVRAMDWAGNRSEGHYCNPEPWRIDTVPPSNPTAVEQTVGETTSGVWQNSVPDPAFTWSGAGDGQSGLWGYRVYFGNNSQGIPDTNTTDAAYDPPQVVTGIYYLRVVAVDVAGNMAPNWATLYTFQFDDVIPEAPANCIQTKGSTTSGVWQNSVSDPTFRWDLVVDAHSGLQGYRYYWGPDPNGTSEDLTTKTVLGPLPVGDGTYHLRISALDRAGNAGVWTAVYIFRFDGTPPTNPDMAIQKIGITANDVWQNAVTEPSFEWSGHADNASGIAFFYVYWGPEASGTASDNTTGPLLVPGSVGDGTCFLRVRTMDLAGNMADWATIYIFRYDGTPPEAPSVDDGKDGYWTTGPVNITLSGPSDMSGISRYVYQVDGGVEASVDGMGTLTYMLLSLSDGTHEVKVKAVDMAGNIGPRSSHTVKVDTVVPAGTISIDGDADHTTSKDVVLALSATDATSGIADMRFSVDGATWGAWEAFAAEMAYSLPSSDGACTVMVQFRDRAGLVSATVEASIILDTVKPAGTVKIDGGSASTDSGSVTLTLDATDENGVIEMRFSKDGSTWGPWVPYDTTYEYDLGSASGKRMVHVQFKDAAGQVSDAATDSIVVEGGGIGSSALIGVGVLLVVIVVVVVLALVLARRRKGGPGPQMVPGPHAQPGPQPDPRPQTETEAQAPGPTEMYTYPQDQVMGEGQQQDQVGAQDTQPVVTPEDDGQVQGPLDGTGGIG